jgi:hypothetical protein
VPSYPEVRCFSLPLLAAPLFAPPGAGTVGFSKEFAGGSIPPYSRHTHTPVTACYAEGVLGIQRMVTSVIGADQDLRPGAALLSPAGRRMAAILRCLFYGFLPPPLEYLWRGYIHYARNQAWWRPEVVRRYVDHMIDNLRSAWVLLTQKELDEEARRFHRL